MHSLCSVACQVHVAHHQVGQAATSGIMIVLVQAVLLLWAQCERHSGRNLCSLYSVTLQVELGLACRLSMEGTR